MFDGRKRNMGAVPKPEKKNKVRKHPERDEFDLEEIAMQLSEAMENKRTYSFLVHNRDEQVVGKVTKMDAATKLITIERYQDVHKIHFLDILKVSDNEL